MHSKLFIVALLALILAEFQNASAQVTGSGDISGVFSNTGPWQVQESIQVSGSNDPAQLSAWMTPRASGDGTNTYSWGLNFPSPQVWYLDGVETPKSEIDALGLSTTDFAARVTRLVVPSTNALTFSGEPFVDQPQGQTFIAGLLEYTNGTHLFQASSGLTSAVDSVLLNVTSVSGNELFNQLLELPITIVNTPNLDVDRNPLPPAVAADFIYFPNRPELGSFRVFEGESTSVEILMEFNSLDLIGFGAVTNPAVGYVTPAVPEPSGLALTFVGALTVVGRKYRRLLRQ